MLENPECYSNTFSLQSRSCDRRHILTVYYITVSAQLVFYTGLVTKKHVSKS